MMYKCAFLFFLFCTSLCRADEIVVHLKHASSLKPLYLHTFVDKQAGFDKAYLDQLEKVLLFDLTHNGQTVVTPQKKEFETKAAYVVKVEVANKNLSTTILKTSDHTMKGIPNIPLKGNLAEDRRKMHAIADTIYEGLFQKKGIASSRILYTVRQKTTSLSYDWLTDIWEADYDGYNARQVTHSGKLCVSPSYVLPTSGAPQDFVYVSYLTGQPKIYLANLKNGASKRATLIKGNQLMPTIAPTKNSLAFVCDIMGNPELFVQSFDPKAGLVGKPWQVTSLPQGAQGSPTFSPDGKQLAFVSNKDGSARIYVTDVAHAGSSAKDLKLKLISKQHRENTCPAWSPDGTKIAYSAKVQGIRQIWIYDFQSNKETQLTNGGGDKENPAWAHNSEHIVFHSTSKSGSELYWISLNEREAVKITQGVGEKRFPAWEPKL